MHKFIPPILHTNTNSMQKNWCKRIKYCFCSVFFFTKKPNTYASNFATPNFEVQPQNPETVFPASVRLFPLFSLRHPLHTIDSEFSLECGASHKKLVYIYLNHCLEVRE